MIGLDELGPLVFGGGAFNTVYANAVADPAADAVATLRAALAGGVRAIDTSAYYGPSEQVLGAALAALAPEFPRDSYFLISKAGRWEDNTFDYTDASLRRSVARSLQRLGTDRLDLLLIHDIEFQTDAQIAGALATAQALRREGLVRFVGFSGYPVDLLVRTAQAAQRRGAPVDAVLSYCNLTLQNTRLLAAAPALRAAGVRVVLNASPLSMSLLRSAPTLAWHPASPELRARADMVAELAAADGAELADLATRFALRRWPGPTVIGLRTPAEVAAAQANLRHAQLPATSPGSTAALEDKAHAAFGDQLDAVWPSGIDRH